MKLRTLALCLAFPSLAVADCESGSCSVADLVAAERAQEKPVATALQEPVAVRCVPVRVRRRCRR